MSIQTELTRLTNAKSAIKAAIEGKGVTVPDATLLDGMAALIESIEAGGGGAVYTFGTFSLSSDTATKDYVLEHGLGVIPQIFILFPKRPSSIDYCFLGVTLWSEGIRQAGYTASKYAVLYANRGVSYRTRASMAFNQSITIDESNITLPDLDLSIMRSGLEHHWIAIGGISV